MKVNKSLLATILLLILAEVNALQIRNFNSDVHDRFSSGYPSNPVMNTSQSFIAAGHDLSGIGWRKSNSGSSHAMVTPLHFLGANHAKPALSDSLRFVNADGVLKSYGINKITTIKNDSDQAIDLFVGELDAPIPPTDNITYYKVGDLPTQASYLGLPILTYGKFARMGAGTIDLFGDLANFNNTRVFVFDYAKMGGDDNDAYGEGGDSGSPSFIVDNGELVLVGTHSALINDTINHLFRTVDAFVPHYLDKINTAIAASGYQVNAPLPITLSNFSATVKSDYSVLLNWITASENNNRGFYIERRQEGTDSKQAWETLGFLDGAGTTTTQRSYQFIDKSPRAGLNYYRLQQVDWDGKTSYSYIVKAILEQQPEEIKLYPNPVSDKLYVSGISVPTTIQIFNQQGVIVFQGKSDTSFSLEHLPAGVYTLQTKTGWTGRFVKR